MRGGPKTLIAAAAAMLLAVALAACGGGSDSSSTTTEATAQGQAAVESSAGGPAQGKAKPGGGEAKSGFGESSAKSGSAGGNSGNFVPKNHHDSGGGSEQFRVKGGDNSIQEFGAEADAAEFDAAAAALHNFLDARAAGDWAAACSYMSKRVTDSLEKLAAQSKQGGATSCGEILEKLTNPAAKQLLLTEAAKADVASLRLEDEGAFIIYTGLGGTALAIPMANEGGAWKVSSLAGTPLQ